MAVDDDEPMSDTIAAFAEAISACESGWKKRWKRLPTLRELVHPFEITLLSSAEDSVEDAETLELIFPKQPARTRVLVSERMLDAERYTPRFDIALGVDLCDLWSEPGRREPTRGEVTGYLEVHNGVLFVDYAENAGRLSDGAVRLLFRERVIGEFLKRKALSVQTVVFRTLSGIGDPVEEPL